MSDINLIYPAIIVQLITFMLFLKSKAHDRYLLFVMIIGQLMLISGESNKNFRKIEISHILYVSTILLGSLYFEAKFNLQFLLFCVIVTLATRQYYNDCLFLMSNENYEFEIYKDLPINYDYLFLISLMIISYRLLKN
jgi:hypothetical protein